MDLIFFVFLSSSSSSFSSVGFWSLGFGVSSGLTVMEIRWKIESERGNACFFFWFLLYWKDLNENLRCCFFDGGKVYTRIGFVFFFFPLFFSLFFLFFYPGMFYEGIIEGWFQG